MTDGLREVLIASCHLLAFIFKLEWRKVMTNFRGRQVCSVNSKPCSRIVLCYNLWFWNSSPRDAVVTSTSIFLGGKVLSGRWLYQSPTKMNAFTFEMWKSFFLGKEESHLNKYKMTLGESRTFLSSSVVLCPVWPVNWGQNCCTTNRINLFSGRLSSHFVGFYWCISIVQADVKNYLVRSILYRKECQVRMSIKVVMCNFHLSWT